MSNMTVSQYVAGLEKILSSDRLNAYRPTGADDLGMVATYFWNVALCQALYPLLGALEVAARNTIHSTLAAHIGRADWYDVPNVLLPNEQRQVNAAKQSIQNSRKPITPGRIVAELSFGFWTSMLSTPYGNSPRGPQFWTSPRSSLLAAAFPFAPPGVQQYRGVIHSRFNGLRLVRNRISHHEPIWNGVRIPSRGQRSQATIVQLSDIHAQILETINWISPLLCDSVRQFDRFTDILNDNQQQTEAVLRNWLEG